MNAIGLYLHIPFCASKCAYCDFVSSPVSPTTVEGQRSMDSMLKATLRHIKETAHSPGGPVAADTVYFGGGTPTLAGEDRLGALLGALRKTFKLSRDAEITVECNPDFAGFKLLKNLRKQGFNRISIGAQSFFEHHLRTLGRRHSVTDIETAVQTARNAGFENISIDLMFGIPGQMPEEWHETLRRAVRLCPEHLSCYALKLEPDTPLSRRLSSPNLTAIPDSSALPGDDETADWYLYTVDYLAHEGFPQYEVSNFSRPGRESRHNLKYWLMRDYLGFGPAAHSDCNGQRFHTLNNPDAYVAAVLDGSEFIETIERVPLEERAAEYVMLGLRLSCGINGNEYARRYRADFSSMEKKLEKFSAYGLTCRKGDSWSLTPKGMLLSNRIIGELLETP